MAAVVANASESMHPAARFPIIPINSLPVVVGRRSGKTSVSAKPLPWKERPGVKTEIEMSGVVS
jgi:hypothetical protein